MKRNYPAPLALVFLLLATTSSWAQTEICNGIDDDGDGLGGLRYAEFTVPLVKAVQEQQVVIGELRTELNAMQLELQQFRQDS